MIKIFDTTLRDGEQSPGFSMNLQEKLMMAKQLEKLGVDVIEAGFANASKGDFESVFQIANTCQKLEVCGLARCHQGDINATIKALENAAKPRIHVFIATSDIHLEYKLKMTREQAVEKAIEAITQAKKFTDRVDFSPEDATRSDWNFLVEILQKAIEAGADTLNIPDTVGYSTPEEYGELIAYLKQNVKGIDNVIISTHCHNDLGLAVANSLAGVRNGATQIECTINGIGERAGNAALEEVVMAMKTRPDIYPAKNRINTTELLATSKLLEQITGQGVQPNKAIVGKNAFAHESGIHQHGMLSNRQTYEIMTPEDVGYKSQLILGKHSGRNAIQSRLQELGIEVEPEQLDQIFVKFKDLADKKKDIYDADLIMLAMYEDHQDKYELVDAHINSDQGQGATAIVTIKADDKEILAKGQGDGAISALYQAITKATGLKGKLIEYKVTALTPNSLAIGVAHIAWQLDDDRIIHADASDTDVVIASGKALVDIINKLEIEKIHGQRINAQNYDNM